MSLTLRLSALLLGFCLDLLFGDPHWMPHPVRAIGALIAGLERLLRAVFPKSDRQELVAGGVLVVLVGGMTTAVTVFFLWLCRQIHPYAGFAAETILCYQILATRSLRDETVKVYTALRDGTIEDARKAVAMVVGRDTDRLDQAGVAKAAVETIAENTADGVIAPLLFLAIGGAPLGMLYKAINTMDSMVGYQSERYLYFGRAAALLDDVVNLIPARLSGVLMCLAARPAGFDGKNAWRIFKRDRANHKSPNSAHTEAAAAGALNIQLAGSNYYFGKLVEKPTIGDALREVEPADILRCNRLMYATAFLSMVLFCGVPLMLSLAL